MSIENAPDGPQPEPAVSGCSEWKEALEEAIAWALDRGPRPAGENVLFRGPLLPDWLPGPWESKTYPSRPEYGPFLEWLDLQVRDLASGILDSDCPFRDAILLISLYRWPLPRIDLEASKTIAGAVQQLGILRDAVERLMQTPAAEGDRPAATGWASAAQLAVVCGVPPEKHEALAMELGRKRRTLGDDAWREVANRQANSPRYLYRSDAETVQAVVRRYL